MRSASSSGTADPVPKGVRLTHRNQWLNAVGFALHAGLNERDVYLHTVRWAVSVVTVEVSPAPE